MTLTPRISLPAAITSYLLEVAVFAAAVFWVSLRDGFVPQGIPAFLQHALSGAKGFAHMIDPATNQRMLIYAAPVFADKGPVLAAITIHLDVETVKAASRGAAEPSFFTDSEGVVFVSNRDELVLRAQQLVVTAPSAVPQDQIKPFPPLTEYTVAGHSIWAMNAGPYLP